jgi:hypothetical protein
MGNPAGKNDRHRAVAVCKTRRHCASLFPYGTVRTPAFLRRHFRGQWIPAVCGHTGAPIPREPEKDKCVGPVRPVGLIRQKARLQIH